MDDPANCHDIAMSIYAGTQYWRTQASTSKQVWDALRDQVMDRVQQYAQDVFNDPSRIIPVEIFTDAMHDVTLSLDQAEANMLSAHASLDYLAIQYNNFGCWNPNSPNWPVETGGGGGRYGCTYEYMDISFDGGNTFHTYYVHVCFYE